MPQLINDHDLGIRLIRNDAKAALVAIANFQQHVQQFAAVLTSDNDGSDTTTPAKLKETDFLGLAAPEQLTVAKFMAGVAAGQQIVDLLSANDDALLNAIRDIAAL